MTKEKKCGTHLMGRISGGTSLTGTIVPEGTLLAHIEIAVASEKVPEYEGTYVITPEIKEQLFETEQKKMKKDLTVLAIPYSAVGNEYGGDTIIIGGIS